MHCTPAARRSRHFGPHPLSSAGPHASYRQSTTISDPPLRPVVRLCHCSYPFTRLSCLIDTATKTPQPGSSATFSWGIPTMRAVLQSFISLSRSFGFSKTRCASCQISRSKSRNVMPLSIRLRRDRVYDLCLDSVESLCKVYLARAPIQAVPAAAGEPGAAAYPARVYRPARLVRLLCVRVTWHQAPQAARVAASPS